MALKSYPMALDDAHHRLFIGCRAPARMLVLDITGKVAASVEIVGDTDDLFYDAARSGVYVVGGAGFIDVFEPKGADRYARNRQSLVPPITVKIQFQINHNISFI